jgi:hypothetical protein
VVLTLSVTPASEYRRVSRVMAQPYAFPIRHRRTVDIGQSDINRVIWRLNGGNDIR